MPKEVIAERVTLEAKRMLSGSDMPVKKLLTILVLMSQPDLVKYFKKIEGHTPTTFRELAISIKKN